MSKIAPSSHSCKTCSASQEDIPSWEDLRCPVCLDHPHNAVLLLCTSHANGCRPFMCDTGHHLSNCLDQYLKLKCPLCRGHINGWKVVEPARRFMNSKSRTCSLETCDFSGSYSDLDRHAREVHPLARPSEVDPVRDQEWRRIQDELGLGDALSAFRFDLSEREALQGRMDDESGNMNDFVWQLFRIAAFAVDAVESGAFSDTEMDALIGDGEIGQLVSWRYFYELLVRSSSESAGAAGGGGTV
ncbi:hypothetical protein QJS04_geneDACA016181 [Acorus gramineus]|uniref:RING-type domain-containing protein n=1 Tax=Acorus gramineus TaxID=55184 RepID=A0AAV9AKC7_ACOGR|nr:hypothetical protein QJS04_geneDACA016181 [Acorus gramineus]